MATVTQSSKLGNIIWPAVAWIVAIVFFFPIFWMVFTSFKTDADAVKPEFLFSFKPTLENYANMAENYDYWRFATNSVITSTFATIFALFVGIPAAYAMAFDPSRHTKDILIPLAWGGIASTALLTFIFCWNEAYWTVRLTTVDAVTLSKLIEGNRAPEGLFFGRLSALSTAAVAPIIILA